LNGRTPRRPPAICYVRFTSIETSLKRLKCANSGHSFGIETHSDKSRADTACDRF
jgi:hypothetical protein